MRYAHESIAGINYVVARYNRHASNDVCAFLKFWREINKNC